MIQKLLEFDISSWFGKKDILLDVYTEPNEAVNELAKRRNNRKLLNRVSEYLNHDIPDHFKLNGGIFYLSRHLATPNFELYHSQKIAERYHLPLVVGEDTRGIFVSRNELKLPLGKLPVVKGVSSTGDEIIENFTIIDFNTSQMKQMSKIPTVFNIPLSTFHKNLLASQQISSQIVVADEADWIDNHFRSDIYEQFKQIFALQCVYSIMLESFTPAETTFLEDVFYPAIKEVEKDIGVKPLIVEHIPSELEITRNWNSYPQSTYTYISKLTKKE